MIRNYLFSNDLNELYSVLIYLTILQYMMLLTFLFYLKNNHKTLLSMNWHSLILIWHFWFPLKLVFLFLVFLCRFPSGVCDLCSVPSSFYVLCMSNQIYCDGSKYTYIFMTQKACINQDPIEKQTNRICIDM